MKNTTGVGDATEWQVAAALVHAGKKLLRPLSSAMRYDFLIDEENGRFTRVQCKTGLLKDGHVVFRLYSVSGHDTRSKHYAGQADAFGVYCPQTQRSYLVPMSAIAECRFFATLRVQPTKNGQRRRTRPAEDFEIRPASSPGTAGSTR